MKTTLCLVLAAVLAGCMSYDSSKLQRLEAVADMLEESKIDSAKLQKMAKLCDSIELNGSEFAVTNGTLVITWPVQH